MIESLSNGKLYRLYQYAQKKVFEALERDNYKLAFVYCEMLEEILDKMYPNFMRGEKKNEKETISDRDSLYLSYDRDRIRTNSVLPQRGDVTMGCGRG